MCEISLILSDIRSCHNVGSILRSADSFGVKHIYFAGLTPYPKISGDQRMPHLINKLTKSIHKTALGAEENILFSLHKNVAEAMKAARKNNNVVACLEQSSKSIALHKHVLGSDIALVLGNEVAGLNEDVLNQSDIILEIPMLGKKESLNVSVTAAIAMYSLRYMGGCNES